MLEGRPGLRRVGVTVSQAMLIQASTPYVIGSAQGITPSGVSLEPYAPAGVNASRNSSRDLIIRWSRCDRMEFEDPDLMRLPGGVSAERGLGKLRDRDPQRGRHGRRAHADRHDQHRHLHRRQSDHGFRQQPRTASRSGSTRCRQPPAAATPPPRPYEVSMANAWNTTELSDSQTGKVASVNLAVKFLQSFLTGARDIATSVPGSPVENGMYIAGSGSISGAWAAYTVNDLCLLLRRGLVQGDAAGRDARAGLGRGCLLRLHRQRLGDGAPGGGRYAAGPRHQRAYADLRRRPDALHGADRQEVHPDPRGGAQPHGEPRRRDGHQFRRRREPRHLEGQRGPLRDDRHHRRNGDHESTTPNSPRSTPATPSASSPTPGPPPTPTRRWKSSAISTDRRLK